VARHSTQAPEPTSQCKRCDVQLASSTQGPQRPVDVSQTGFSVEHAALDWQLAAGCASRETSSLVVSPQLASQRHARPAQTV
jgi:hypothetical protein